MSDENNFCESEKGKPCLFLFWHCSLHSRSSAIWRPEVVGGPCCSIGLMDRSTFIAAGAIIKWWVFMAVRLRFILGLDREVSVMVSVQLYIQEHGRQPVWESRTCTCCIWLLTCFLSALMIFHRLSLFLQSICTCNRHNQVPEQTHTQSQ